KVHSITIQLAASVVLDRMQLQFQGGYGCKRINCSVLRDTESPIGSGTKDTGSSLELTFYPQDSNGLQSFEFPAETICRSLNLQLTDNSDMFGRVILYRLDIFGRSCQL